MNTIKQRRLTELTLASHPDLHVGRVRAVLFLSAISDALFDLSTEPGTYYRGGQGAIIHLEADLHATVTWANAQARRWAFSLSNAGSRYFEDRADLARLGEINWDAVQANNWQQCKEEKQAEFLLENSFPLALGGAHWRVVESCVWECSECFACKWT
jgi:hypothetical protein